MHSFQRLKEINFELEQLEKEAKENRAMFEAIFNAAPDGIAVINNEGSILRLNPAMQALLGNSEKELIGTPIENLIPYKKDGDFKRVSKCGGDVIIKDKEGKDICLNVALSPIRVNGYIGTVVIVRDLS